MTSQRLPGHLFAVEGVDGCGKTAVARALVARLRALGLHAHIYRFPDRHGATGTILGAYMRDACTPGRRRRHVLPAHVMFAGNRWTMTPGMRLALERGDVVVVDRYVLSALAYANAAVDDDSPLPPHYPNPMGLPRPTLTLLLDAAVDAARLSTQSLVWRAGKLLLRHAEQGQHYGANIAVLAPGDTDDVADAALDLCLEAMSHTHEAQRE